MEVLGINNSFRINNYSTQTIQGTYLNNQFPVVSSSNTGGYIKATGTNINFVSGAFENTINGFQAAANFIGPLDNDLEDIRNLINKISFLKENLNMYNLGDTLRELKSIGNGNYELRQQALKMQELHENEQSVAIRSYMYSLYDKVCEKKIQSLGLDVYY